MPTVMIDGISTRYDVIGEGPPLLMFSPGGFDATVEKWSSLGVYVRTRPLDNLSKKYKCIVFDRRECGQSDGRVERVNWSDYIAQGKGLLDHLGIERAHIMGGCMGCSSVMAFAVAYPEATMSMVLYWPVGGAKYRLSGHQRFAEHLAFVHQNGLEAVAALVAKDGKAFGADPRGGPWASVLRNNPAFAAEYVKMNVDKYKLIVASMGRTLIDRDTSPGAEPEDLMRLDIPAIIVPGRDASHATSAARYLQECLSKSEYWDIAPDDQNEQNTTEKLYDFLARATAA
jgi:pimeloyl-ACP methyl ester carboxylesterase